MDNVKRRSKRIVEKKDELQEEIESVSGTRKWSEEELLNLMKCLQLYGHNNIDKMVECVPGKSADDIRKYLLGIHASGRSIGDTMSNIQSWLGRTKSEMEKNPNVKSSDYYQLALLMKCLTVDGLIENHPDPKSCNGIDFVAAYRLLYQALLGYPLQPVNKATADFICDTFLSITGSMNVSTISRMTEILQSKFGVEKDTVDQATSVNGDAKSSNHNKDVSFNLKKPVKVYQRKRPAPVQVSDVPPIKVVFKEGDTISEGNMKCFSLEINGKKSSSVVVPIPFTISESKLELEKSVSKLWSSIGFNPLGLPEATFKNMTI